MTLFTVPARTPSFPCRSCGKRCYWIRTKNDRPMLVDCDVPDGWAPTDEQEGRGASHFSTCPDADKHRKKKGRA